MKKKVTIVIILLCFKSLLFSNDIYENYKYQYDSLRKRKEHDFALQIAMKMNDWVLKNESDTSLRYALSLKFIGNCYYSLNKNDSSINYFESYIRNLELQNRKEHKDFAAYVNILGILYYKIADYKTSEHYFIQALEIRKKFLGSDHLDYANSFDNLGNLYSEIGEYRSAEHYFIQALEIRKKFLGSDHSNYASSLNNLGSLFYRIGENKIAESYFKQALEIYEKSLGVDHHLFAKSLINLGVLYSKIIEYKSAESYYKQALEIYEKSLGVDHPDYSDVLKKLGSLYSKMGDYKIASSFYNESLNINVDNLSKNFTWLSSNEKQAYWYKEKKFYDQLNRFVASAYNLDSSPTELVYNANLISKSLMLENSLAIEKAILKSNNEVLKTQYTEFKKNNLLYNKMLIDRNSNKDMILKYKKQVDSLDKIIVAKSSDYAALKYKYQITWKDVQHCLEEKDAAIDFSTYYDKNEKEFKYLAFVLRPNFKYPKLIKIGKEDLIKNAIQEHDFNTLYKEVWSSIDSLLTGVKRIYYSPSGVLNNLSFSALCYESFDEQLLSKNTNIRAPKDNNKTIINKVCHKVLMDKYELHQLTTTRYIADGTLSKEKMMSPRIELIGGINYDDYPTQNDMQKINDSNKLFVNLAFRDNVNTRKKTGRRSSSNFGKKMKYLEGTEDEVLNIKSILQQMNWNINLKTDKNVGEFDLKKDLEINNPGIIHIATHGFAFPEISVSDSGTLDDDNNNIYKQSEDPMFRCGLMLSGSNISWIGKPENMLKRSGEDGILTAAEVANLNLSNTKLVVLSACETGLGQVESTEGTFGLKRGFKLAGLEQIIVSLWSVPDKETMDLMTLFYKDLTKTLNPVVSFEKAQKELRNTYPKNPEKWAGFVLVR